MTMREKFGIDVDGEVPDCQPAKSHEEAAAIVRANPITKDMTYEERLAVIKRRFGL